MRPVEKWSAGHHGTEKEYTPYKKARPQLLLNLGRYCSYCEMVLKNVGSAEVEHVEARDCGGSEFDWDNFLLSCKTCNQVKSAKDHKTWPAKPFFPHWENTYAAFSVDPINADVIPRNSLSPADSLRAKATILDLLRLNEVAGPSDMRKENRIAAKNKAVRQLNLYEPGNADSLQSVIDFAQETGFWLVWMEVFQNHPEVQDALIKAFDGTYADCRNGRVTRP